MRDEANVRARSGAASPRSWSAQIPFAGAVLVGLGFALAISSRWVGWPWLRFAPYAMLAGVAILLVVGLAPIYRAIFAEFRGWFEEGAARNGRGTPKPAAQTQDESDPPAPNAP